MKRMTRYAAAGFAYQLLGTREAPLADWQRDIALRDEIGRRAERFLIWENRPTDPMLAGQFALYRRRMKEATK